jgi:hypothetical protein
MNEIICLFCKGRFSLDEFEDKDNPACTECLQEHEEADERDLSISENPYYDEPNI